MGSCCQKSDPEPVLSEPVVSDPASDPNVVDEILDEIVIKS